MGSISGMEVKGALLFKDEKSKSILIMVGSEIVQLTRGEWSSMISRPHEARTVFQFDESGNVVIP
jgi:hypothetical protein